MHDISVSMTRTLLRVVIARLLLLRKILKSRNSGRINSLIVGH